MISGPISAQQLISEVERDSIVAKITRGEECAEKQILANEVIAQADSVIFAQKNVIISQKNVISNYDKQVKLFKENEFNLYKVIENEKEIGKIHKKKQFGWFIKGVKIGVSLGVIGVLLI